MITSTTQVGAFNWLRNTLITICAGALFFGHPQASPSPFSHSDPESEIGPCGFKVIAEFGAGYSVFSSWDTVITADGKVVQRYWDPKQERTVIKKRALTKEQIGKLRAAFQNSRFFAFKKRYTHQADDQVSISLTVSVQNKTHTVGVYGPGALKSNPDVREFCKLWDEVLRMVPDPNEELLKTLKKNSKEPLLK